jgi:signal transduction histidine kinase
MLSSAQLISDRLSLVQDDTVQRFVPKLISSLDRAIAFLTQTLRFGRAQELPPVRGRLALRELADEVIESAVVQTSSRIVLYNRVPHDAVADADREQLIRVLTNLLRNAIQAIESRQENDPQSDEGHVSLRAWREGSVAIIEIKDNGPGIPEKVRSRLFEAFQSAARAGGVGLGLAISAELVRAHGGEIRLVSSGAGGTVFQVTVPDAVTELRSGRRGERQQVSSP